MALIIRSSKPSKHDQLIYASICKTIKALSDEFDIYVQMSHDEKNPQWEKVGTFSPETNDLVIDEINKLLNMKQVR